MNNLKKTICNIKMIKFLNVIHQIKTRYLISLLNNNRNITVNHNFQNINKMGSKIETRAGAVCNNNRIKHNNKISKTLLLQEVKNLPARRDNKLWIFFHKARKFILNRKVQYKLLVTNKHPIFLIKLLSNPNHKEIKIDKDKWPAIIFLEEVIKTKLLKDNVK